MYDKQPIFVFISGEGKTLDAIIRGSEVADVKYVYSNIHNAMGLTRARDFGVKRLAETTNKQIVPETLNYMIDNVGVKPKLIVLAGYMKILTLEFIEYANGLGIDIVNIHPSLLPKHKGLHTHQRVLDSGDNCHGLTIHYVTEQLDSGPTIHQTEFNVVENDTVEALTQAVKIREQLVYPMIIDGLLLNEKPPTVGR